MRRAPIEDVAEASTRLARAPAPVGLPPEVARALEQQQRRWSESGPAAAIFESRFDPPTPDEGKAVLAFLDTFKQAHGGDFPFDEIDLAIEKHGGRYPAG